jgi:hypothetical protein
MLIVSWKMWCTAGSAFEGLLLKSAAPSLSRMEPIRSEMAVGEVFSEGAIRFLLGSASGTRLSTQAPNSPMESSLPELLNFMTSQMRL